VTRITERFAALEPDQGKAFIAYLTAGDPNLESTHDMVLALVAAGADIIELGVPFSDPIADGPVIQRATDRALRGEVTLPAILRLVARLRTRTEAPIVLMSYYNPLLRFGLERLAREARDSGVDGILASDLTVEESAEYLESMHGAGIDTVFVVAPTSSPARQARIAATSTGFLYAVSRTGVTGEQSELPADLVEFVRSLRRQTRKPIAVGFGVSTPEQVRAVWAVADGVVVGSALVHAVERGLEAGAGREDLARLVGDAVRRLRDRG
jgi:tryptophan synthase alpha chain